MKDDVSGLYKASGLKEIFEKAEKEREKEKRKQQESFWKDIENEKDIFDESKIEIKENDDIDPFWLS